ncbi:MAG: gfo/Idh/MocA family oxidoreductase, partial [Planctomycetaceae bacterium]
MLPPQIHRREFIDQAVAAALAALAVGGARPVAAQPEAKVAGPNERLRAAVIGCNGQGGAHIGEWLRNPEVELVAVCDCDPAAYAKHAGRLEKLDKPPKYVQDVRKL